MSRQLYVLDGIIQGCFDPLLQAKRERLAKEVSHRKLHGRGAYNSGRKLLGGVDDYPCGSLQAADKWIGQPEVIEALHVKRSMSGMKYTKGPMDVSGDLRPLYKKIIEKYRVLIYSGDIDACVPYYGTEEWIRDLGFEQEGTWSAW